MQSRLRKLRKCQGALNLVYANYFNICVLNDIMFMALIMIPMTEVDPTLAVALNMQYAVFKVTCYVFASLYSQKVY